MDSKLIRSEVIADELQLITLVRLLALSRIVVSISVQYSTECSMAPSS